MSIIIGVGLGISTKNELFLHPITSTFHSQSMKYTIIILMSFFSIVCHSPGGTPKNNYDLLMDLAAKTSQSVSTYLTKQHIDSCGIHLSDHPAQSMLVQALVDTKGKYFTSGRDSRVNLDIEIRDIAVRYFRYTESQDSLIREAQILVRGIVASKNEALRSLPEIGYLSRDTISRTDIRNVENPGYVYTKSPVPDPERSLLSEIAEPLGIIAVAAISVLLLFSIRSQ